MSNPMDNFSNNNFMQALQSAQSNPQASDHSEHTFYGDNKYAGSHFYWWYSLYDLPIGHLRL